MGKQGHIGKPAISPIVTIYRCFFLFANLAFQKQEHFQLKQTNKLLIKLLLPYSIPHKETKGRWWNLRKLNGWWNCNVEDQVSFQDSHPLESSTIGNVTFSFLFVMVFEVKQSRTFIVISHSFFNQL